MQIKSLIFLSAILLLASCSTQQEAPKVETPAVPVLTTLPTVKNVPVYVEAIGTLHPSVFMEIRPQVSGKIAEVLVSEGDWVDTDKPLFRIDPVPYQIKVKEAEAQLAMDKSTLQAALKKLDRFKNLAHKDLIAQTEWDELETQTEKAKAALELDEANVQTAQLDLDRCTLTSPIKGRVGKLDVHPGILVGAGQALPLVTISKLDPLIVEFNVTEKEFPKLLQEMLEFELQSLSCVNTCRSGKITFLDNHFDSKTGQILVRGTVDNHEHSLRPGQSIKVRVPVSVRSNVMLIPQKAVRYNQQGPYVYIVQPDQTVGFRQILLGTEVGGDVIVTEGIDAAENVITDGHLRLSPGLKVEIKS